MLSATVVTGILKVKSLFIIFCCFFFFLANTIFIHICGNRICVSYFHFYIALYKVKVFWYVVCLQIRSTK